jgi:hypothetical protein
MKQRNQMVTKRAYSIFALVVLLPSSAVFQETPKPPRVPIPLQVTVCQILRAPYQFDGKIVQVRGYIVDSDEYSLLAEEGCQEDGIWFRFADGSGLPGLKILTLPAHPENARATKTSSNSLPLTRDKNYFELIRRLQQSVKGNACADGPPPEFPPDCTSYKITATFVGKVHGVSQRTFENRKRQKQMAPADGKGFGQMGIFSAEILAQSVSDITLKED